MSKEAPSTFVPLLNNLRYFLLMLNCFSHGHHFTRGGMYQVSMCRSAVFSAFCVFALRSGASISIFSKQGAFRIATHEH